MIYPVEFEISNPSLTIEDLRIVVAKILSEKFLGIPATAKIDTCENDLWTETPVNLWETIRCEFNEAEYMNAVGWNVQWQGNHLVFRIKSVVMDNKPADIRQIQEAL